MRWPWSRKAKSSNAALIAVLAKLAPKVGEPWPPGSFVYVDGSNPFDGPGWFEIEGDMTGHTRREDEWSEAEANARGEFKEEVKRRA